MTNQLVQNWVQLFRRKSRQVIIPQPQRWSGEILHQVHTPQGALLEWVEVRAGHCSSSVPRKTIPIHVVRKRVPFGFHNRTWGQRPKRSFQGQANTSIWIILLFGFIVGHSCRKFFWPDFQLESKIWSRNYPPPPPKISARTQKKWTRDFVLGRTTPTSLRPETIPTDEIRINWKCLLTSLKKNW